jgi:predicted TIM-barrel fold metal-dependent hydrolase
MGNPRMNELDHPVIDADGHVIELIPAALPYLRDALGPRDFERYRAALSPLSDRLGSASEDRWATRAAQGGWWSSPLHNVRDLAASIAPRLLAERLPEVGIDYSVLYPTLALATAAVEDDGLRVGLCRGWNDYFADTYAPFADRMTPAGIIPMHTPSEAIAELEHCRSIGLKVAGIPHTVVRAITSATPSPWRMPGQTHWCDFFGLDSAYDYDPVWSKFGELGFAITVHVGVGAAPMGWYHWVSNFVANHVGSFAWGCHPLCKALLLGGVTRRFPDAVIAFQECGVSWATTLLADLIEHWEKRNTDTMRSVFDPQLFDLPELRRYVTDYAPELLADVDDVDAALRGAMLWGRPPEHLDEFAAMQVASEHDIIDLAAPRLWFGCEADDRTVIAAFAEHNGLGVDFNVMLGSDISHFDTPDMDAVVPSACRLVEKGLLDHRQLRALLCDNAARLFTHADPNFFAGTALADYLPAAPVAPTAQTVT